MSNNPDQAITSGFSQRYLARKVTWCELIDNRGAELLNALMMFLFGLWALSPFWKLFDTCPYVYFIMDVIMSENKWGLLFLLMSGVKFYALWTNKPDWRRYSSLICGALWSMTALTVAFSDIRAPAFPLYLVLAANMYRVFICFSIQRRRYGRRLTDHLIQIRPTVK
jgi:hypothetical protein